MPVTRRTLTHSRVLEGALLIATCHSLKTYSMGVGECFGNYLKGSQVLLFGIFVKVRVRSSMSPNTGHSTKESFESADKMY
jgi:hypothetical protein